ncbi:MULTISPECIES: stage II sporulation protein R [unclassified Clostridium]|uniref:stage II sporulation protein R n=1 Tax=unclassified Clostridium TaxID=2614128 RepID=UPI00189A01D0|nr:MULTISPECIES: stage II sporulation protein R [unclassified Clostridium]MBP3916266.1 stage II sporulation protein R [Clostridium sp.]MEE0932265.1 stage II sporulation protein R [Clostridium sp.]
MKKYIYFIVPIVLVVLILNGCQIFGNNTKESSLELTELNYDDIKDKLIRFHVIANSDTYEDQNLKLKVRDKVVEALSEKLSNVNSVEEAENILEENIDYVNEIAKEVIEENNYTYKVTTMLSYENFPDKVYGDCVFPQGNYEAFRVIIGEGKGQNWWCVMFPSLCFVDESKNSVDSSNLKDEIEDIEPKDDNTTNEDKEKNNESSNVNSGIKFKFKILEAIENIFD